MRLVPTLDVEIRCFPRSVGPVRGSGGMDRGACEGKGVVDDYKVGPKITASRELQ